MKSDTLHFIGYGDTLKSIDYNSSITYCLPKNKIIKPINNIALRESIFKENSLKSNNFSEKQNYHNQDWITGIIILILVMVSYVKNSNSKRLKTLLNCLGSLRFVSQLTRDGSIFSQQGAAELFVIFILTSALFIFQILNFYNLNILHFNNFFTFSIISLSLFLLYTFKSFILKTIGIIFQLKREFSEYIINLFVFNEAIGIALIPVVLGIAFLNYGKLVLINLGLIIVVLFYFYRIIRGIGIASVNSKFSKFYLFLYLCTLEVLPLIVLIKIFLKFN